MQPIRARSLQTADHQAIADLSDRGLHWEPATRPFDRVYELHHTIVAASASVVESIARPTFPSDPVPEVTAWPAGDQLALVGAGLVFAPDLPIAAQTLIHRLARTLASQERGTAWCMLVSDLPPLDLPPGAILQQIAFGAVDHPPITIPLLDGYWPIATSGGRAILARQNRL